MTSQTLISWIPIPYSGTAGVHVRDPCSLTVIVSAVAEYCISGDPSS